MKNMRLETGTAKYKEMIMNINNTKHASLNLFFVEISIELKIYENVFNIYTP